MNYENYGEATGGFRLSISTDRTKFKLGDPIDVRLQSCNVSETARALPSTRSFHQGYSLEVTREDKSVPLTEFGLRMEDAQRESSYAEPECGPGPGPDCSLPLSRLFDFSAAGIYLVQATRPVFRDASRDTTLLRSNSLRLVVQ
jgi:hypothetical protein